MGPPHSVFVGKSWLLQMLPRETSSHTVPYQEIMDLGDESGVIWSRLDPVDMQTGLDGHHCGHPVLAARSRRGLLL